MDWLQSGPPPPPLHLGKRIFNTWFFQAVNSGVVIAVPKNKSLASLVVSDDHFR